MSLCAQLNVNLLTEERVYALPPLVSSVYSVFARTTGPFVSYVFLQGRPVESNEARPAEVFAWISLLSTVTRTDMYVHF